MPTFPHQSHQHHHVEQQQQQQQQMQTKMEQLQLRQDPSPVAAPAATTVPVDVEWLYLDPQGNLQGPFTRVDMLEWYGSGYFAATLMLRRTCDQRCVSV